MPTLKIKYIKKLLGKKYEKIYDIIKFTSELLNVTTLNVKIEDKETTENIPKSGICSGGGETIVNYIKDIYSIIMEKPKDQNFDINEYMKTLQQMMVGDNNWLIELILNNRLNQAMIRIILKNDDVLRFINYNYNGYQILYQTINNQLNVISSYIINYNIETKHILFNRLNNFTSYFNNLNQLKSRKLKSEEDAKIIMYMISYWIFYYLYVLLTENKLNSNQLIFNFIILITDIINDFNKKMNEIGGDGSFSLYDSVMNSNIHFKRFNEKGYKDIGDCAYNTKCFMENYDKYKTLFNDKNNIELLRNFKFDVYQLLTKYINDNDLLANNFNLFGEMSTNIIVYNNNYAFGEFGISINVNNSNVNDPHGHSMIIKYPPRLKSLYDDIEFIDLNDMSHYTLFDINHYYDNILKDDKLDTDNFDKLIETFNNDDMHMEEEKTYYVSLEISKYLIESGVRISGLYILNKIFTDMYKISFTTCFDVNYYIDDINPPIEFNYELNDDELYLLKYDIYTFFEIPYINRYANYIENILQVKSMNIPFNGGIFENGVDFKNININILFILFIILIIIIVIVVIVKIRNKNKLKYELFKYE